MFMSMFGMLREISRSPSASMVRRNSRREEQRREQQVRERRLFSHPDQRQAEEA